jgi:hypothetical protein
MATFKIIHFKRVTLLNKTPIGYILTLKDGDGDIWTLWGGQIADGYLLTEWGTPASTFDVKEYEDGFVSTVLLTGIPNAQTITNLTNSNITSTATLDINSLQIGVTPRSLDAGITQTTSGGAGTFSLSSETYKPYCRQIGWLIYEDAALCTACYDPIAAINFGSVAMIANYAEVAFEINGAEKNVTTAKMGSRVRWGDADSALCQVLVEADTTNSAGYLDLIETVGTINGMLPFEDRVVAFKNESIYEIIYAGSPKLFTHSVVVPDNGSISTHSIRKVGSKRCTFLGNDSFWIYSMGGELADIGKPIADRIFGYNAEYNIEDIQKAVVQVFDERGEIWIWFPTKLGVANSEIYKYKDGSWTMTDYYTYGHGHIGYLGRDYYSSGGSSKGWVPIIFFDELNLTTATSTTYSPNLKATMNGYRDLQSGVDDNTAQFETKDFPLSVGGRVTELEFQAKSDTSPTGNIVVYHSLDEGTSWSAGSTIYVKPSPDLDWYSYPFDATGESVRFKFITEHDVSIGELKLKVSSRTRRTSE